MRSELVLMLIPINKDIKKWPAAEFNSLSSDTQLSEASRCYFTVCCFQFNNCRISSKLLLHVEIIVFLPRTQMTKLEAPCFSPTDSFFFCVTAPTWQSQLHLSDCAFPHCSLRTEPSGARAAAASWICIWPSALIKLHFNVRFDWLNHSSYEHTHSPAKLQLLSCSSGFTLTRVHSSLCWPVLNYSLPLSLGLPLSLSLCLLSDSHHQLLWLSLIKCHWDKAASRLH